jgi:hypothetical protein
MPTPARALAALLAVASLQAQGGVDLRHTFFSRRESWIALYPPEDRPATLRYVFSRMLEEKGPWLDLAFRPLGKDRSVAITADPTRIRVDAGGASGPWARVYLRGRAEAVLEARDMEVELTSAKEGLALDGSGSGRTAHLAAAGWTLTLDLARGSVAFARGAWRLRPEGGALLATFHMAQEPAGALPAPETGADLEAIRRDWEGFRARMPRVPPGRTAQAEAAWWNLWSLYAPADTCWPTPAVLAAKVDMNALWPWDHCFPAMALGLTDLQAGLDQFLLPFLLAGEDGSPPDETAPDATYRGVTKPPIHGWVLGRLMDRHALSRAQMEAVYPRLAKWTEFWFRYRDKDGDGIPEYGGEHPGWESGWDNASAFGPDPATPLESPDLQAYLVLQMRTLARLAAAMDRPAEAREWERRAKAHLDLLLDRFWKDGRFLVRWAGRARPEPAPTSLLPLMPLVLGDLLPPEVFKALASDLERRFLTPWGPATEDPSSALYRPDGYWLGPVWAPTAYLLADGLRRGGRKDLAYAIARRFCDLVAHAGGCYENYDALSGKGLRCRGFAWTSAVEILFLNEYLLPENDRPDSLQN